LILYFLYKSKSIYRNIDRNLIYRNLFIGWELHRRLHFIENNWPYFLGFGLPLAFATYILPNYYLSGGVFSMLFPLFIISANEAKPRTGICDFQIHVFSAVVWLSNKILFFVFKVRVPGNQPNRR